jgi:NTP pyrophosphatase (non-canonical NTP hydrolase)
MNSEYKDEMAIATEIVNSIEANMPASEKCKKCGKSQAVDYCPMGRCVSCMKCGFSGECEYCGTSKMALNNLRDEIWEYADKQGFHERPFNLGESLMLIVSELSEAIEADRKGKWTGRDTEILDGRNLLSQVPEIGNVITKEIYQHYVKGTVEDEIADAIMRLCALAGSLKIDIEWHVRMKMSYNETRAYKHGKNYG